MIPQSESGSQSGVAQAGISQGAITITNKDAQKQDVATLNRDTSNTNTTVGKNPDLNNILSQQSDMMAAAQAAGEAVAKTVGDIAGKKEKEAQARLDVADQAYKQDPSDANKAALDAAQADVKGWAEGGDYRAALHMAGGALIAGLGGGNAVAGAVGAGVSSKLAPELKQLGKTVAGDVNTGNVDLNEAIGNLAANIVAGGIGAAVGGGSGAATAANVDRYNRQLHPDEQKWIKDNAKTFAQQQGISLQEAEQRLAQQAFRQVQDGVGGAEDSAARSFLSQAHGMLAPDPSCPSCGLSYMFHPTAAQKANADMYANYLPQDRQNWFYMQNGLTQPTPQQVAAGASQDGAQRLQVANQTVNAVGAAAAIAVGPGIVAAAPGVVNTTVTGCSLNPGACAAAAGIGGVVSGAADVAGQAILNNGTIRPGQTAMATVAGAILTPFGLNAGVYGNAVLGSINSIVNSEFQNLFYGDQNSLVGAAGVGGVFGLGGAYAAKYAQLGGAFIFPKYQNNGVPALLQMPSQNAPLIGVAAGNVAQGGGSLVQTPQKPKQ